MSQVPQTSPAPAPELQMSTFHLFTSLPPELRGIIWSFAVEPCEMSLLFDKERVPGTHLSLLGSSRPRKGLTTLDKPVLGVFHACFESRAYLFNAGGYTKWWIDTARYTPSRYIIVNFALETIFLDWYDVHE